MVIFHSYVNLPEGNQPKLRNFSMSQPADFTKSKSWEIYHENLLTGA